MSTNLMQASNQWRTRPADQRFWDIDSMYVKACAFHFGLVENAPGKYEKGPGGVKTSKGPIDALHVEVIEGDTRSKDPTLHKDIIIRAGEKVLNPTNWAFRQLCSKLNAHSTFLQTCDAEDVASILNKRIDRIENRSGEVPQVRFMEHLNGHRELMAVTGVNFGTIWNHDVIRWVKDSPLLAGWQTPPARPVGTPGPTARKATKADITNKAVSTSGLQVKVGDWIEPAGLYLSREDMFILRVNEDRRTEDGSEGGLAQGMMIGNSEVGKSRIWGLMFDYREICGNHIVWDASNIISFRMRHVGRSTAKDRAFLKMEKMVALASKASTRLDMERIRDAKNTLVCDADLPIIEQRKQTAERLYGKRMTGFTLNAANKSLELAEQYGPGEKCHPFSVWGVVNGITRWSQTEKNFDRRLVLDAAAGKLLAPFTKAKTEAMRELADSV